MSDEQIRQRVENIKEAWSYDPLLMDIWGFVPEDEEELLLPYKEELEAYQIEVEQKRKWRNEALDYRRESLQRAHRMTTLAQQLFVSYIPHSQTSDEKLSTYCLKAAKTFVNASDAYFEKELERIQVNYELMLAGLEPEGE